jgi:hypothetical protein
MSSNLIQFASIFDAAGCKINFNSHIMEAEIISYPTGRTGVIEGAIDEIDCFLDTKTFNDGIAILAIADQIDGNPNPLAIETRNTILNNAGLKKNNRYITQALALLKTNKSWHSSEVPNECTYFGDLCTTRGITEVDGKRGRKSSRLPDDYHIRKTSGIINREQLITPLLEEVYRAIPQENLISMKPKEGNIINLDKIDELEPEELARILQRIREAEVKVNDA